MNNAKTKEEKGVLVMDMEDTMAYMISKNYQRRFIAEYWQVKNRYERLKMMIENWYNLKIKPVCEKEIYIEQLSYMKGYLDILEKRAIKEGIEL